MYQVKRFSAAFAVAALGLLSGCDNPTASRDQDGDAAKIEALARTTKPATVEEAVHNLEQVMPANFQWTPPPLETETTFEDLPEGVAAHPEGPTKGSHYGNWPMGVWKYAVLYGPHWGYAGPYVGDRVHWNVDFHRATAPFKYWSSGSDDPRKTRIINMHVSFLKQAGKRCMYVWVSYPWSERLWCVPDLPYKYNEAVNKVAEVVYNGFRSYGMEIAWGTALAIAYIIATSMVLVTA
jgi:hypothetical protein